MRARDNCCSSVPSRVCDIASALAKERVYGLENAEYFASLASSARHNIRATLRAAALRTLSSTRFA